MYTVDLMTLGKANQYENHSPTCLILHSNLSEVYGKSCLKLNLQKQKITVHQLGHSM